MESRARDEFTAMLVVLFGEQVARDPQLVSLLDRVVSESASNAIEGYRSEVEARINSLNAALEQKTFEYNQVAARVDALDPANVEATLKESSDALALATSQLEEATQQRDALQSQLDDIMERVREAQRQSRAQIDEALAKASELEAALAEAPEPGSLAPSRAQELTAAIVEAMDAYRARTDAIAAEDEPTARTEDARLTAAVRRAFHATTASE